MSEVVNDLVDKFQEQGEKVINFVNSIPDGVLDKQLYDDGAQWTIRQTLVHFVES